MNCEICKENLVCYVEGLLDEQEGFAVEEHINICQECEFQANEITKLRERLIFRGGEVSENVFLEEKVLEQIYIEKSQSTNYSPVANLTVSIKHLRRNLVKYIAAASIAIALVLGIHLLGNSTAEANVVWTRVADDILNAETAAFDVALGGGPVIKNIVGGQYRKQILGNGLEQITDYGTGHILILNSIKKTAYFTESGNIANYSTNYFQYLRDKIEILKLSPNTKVAVLGTRLISDRPTDGLHIYNDSIDLKIWTDVEDALLALIIYDKTLGQTTLEMRNFKFNIPVEELALSMDVPQGYTLEPLAVDFTSLTEQDLIGALNIWADIYPDGHFPDGLNGDLLISQAEVINKRNEELGMTEKGKLAASLQITKGLLFIQNLAPDSDWQYTGKGVTINDAMSIIFRYKPEGSETYRVIYGDLTVEDADLNN